MKLRYFKIIMMVSGVIALSSCKKLMDINKDPDRIPDSNIPMAQLLPSVQVNLGFEGGSDLYRFTTLIMQQMSGEASQPNQTYEYYRYNITGSDQNNVWSSIFSSTLSDLELMIKQATTNGSPHFAGVGKILKAYEYSLVVDTWGDVPYSEAQLLAANLAPHYDDDATIYPKLIQLLNDGIADVSQATSNFSPSATNSVIYPGAFATVKANWIKLANTLKLRLFLHYSKKDPAFATAQMTALINSAGVTFFSSNADNFQLNFFNVANQRNPISAFEVSRANYLFADAKMIGMMNAKNDPRRGFYFTSFPYAGAPIPFNLNTFAATTGNTLQFSATSGVVVGLRVAGTNIPVGTTVTAVTATIVTLSNNMTGAGAAAGAPITFSPLGFLGVSAASPPVNPSTSFSRVHTFLRGAVTAGTTPPFTYSGAAPQRMLSFAEYCFIRAEAALMGSPGSAQQFFTDGITASMTEAGVSTIEIANYLAASGTLAGTNAQMLQQIIEEKYIALFGVSVEPWNDWRRTGYPALSIPTNAIGAVNAVPRTLFYPQSEIDLNPNHLPQKAASLQDRVFWDTP